MGLLFVFSISSKPKGASLMAQWVKNLSAMQETQETFVLSLGWEDPLQEEMVTYSSILGWKKPSLHPGPRENCSYATAPQCQKGWGPLLRQSLGGPKHPFHGYKKKSSREESIKCWHSLKGRHKTRKSPSFPWALSFFEVS